MKLQIILSIVISAITIHVSAGTVTIDEIVKSKGSLRNLEGNPEII